MSECLIIGTRGSKLALTQSDWVKRLLQEQHPGLEIRLEAVETRGDRMSGSLRSFGGQGIFTTELEKSLLSGAIDLAVHSLKDLPTGLHEDLAIAAIPSREDARDVLIAREPKCSIEDLPKYARLGTGSLRRRSQLSALRPDFQYLDIRGNIDTRLCKLREGECDVLVLAAAALHRLRWQTEISTYIELDQMLPAPGQGALALQMRRDDGRADLVTTVQDSATRVAVTAERSMLSHLGGGCQAPIAAYGRISGSELLLTGLVGEIDGSHLIRAEETSRGEAADLGKTLAEKLQHQGAGEILARSSSP